MPFGTTLQACHNHLFTSEMTSSTIATAATTPAIPEVKSWL
jgi:hypothetical protein